MRQICCIVLFFFTFVEGYAQNFADYFQDKTLRVDYIFTGDARQQAIYSTNCHNFLPGQVASIIYPNSHWKATVKSS